MSYARIPRKKMQVIQHLLNLAPICAPLLAILIRMDSLSPTCSTLPSGSLSRALAANLYERTRLHACIHPDRLLISFSLASQASLNPLSVLPRDGYATKAEAVLDNAKDRDEERLIPLQ
jgi:hypothetical protein